MEEKKNREICCPYHSSSCLKTHKIIEMNCDSDSSYYLPGKISCSEMYEPTYCPKHVVLVHLKNIYKPDYFYLVFFFFQDNSCLGCMY